MKKMGLLVIGVFALFGFVAKANAASSLSMSCDNKRIEIGKTANCVVYLDADVTASHISVELAPSRFLDISGVTPNKTIGWEKDSSGTNETAYLFAFSNAAGITGKKQLFSFNVTLNEAAKGLSEGDDCGSICLSSFILNKSGNKNDIDEGLGTCFMPVPVLNTVVDNPKNPETGAFMDYAIIAGVGIIAVAGVIIARKSTKFYRV